MMDPSLVDLPGGGSSVQGPLQPSREVGADSMLPAGLWNLKLLLEKHRRHLPGMVPGIDHLGLAAAPAKSHDGGFCSRLRAGMLWLLCLAIFSGSWISTDRQEALQIRQAVFYVGKCGWAFHRTDDATYSVHSYARISISR